MSRTERFQMSAILIDIKIFDWQFHALNLINLKS